MLTDLLALAAVMVWPVVPLFWIPVHGFPKLFKRLGKWTYLMPAVLWPPIAYLVFAHRTYLLHYRIDLPLLLRAAGFVIMATGTAIHLRTGVLLSLRGLMGLPEVMSETTGRLVTEGVFGIVRHPTYLAHTLMFAGAFLLTSVAAVGIVTLLDFLVVNSIVIPLEERELAARFGKEYAEYRRNVPKYFPRIGKR